MIWPGTLPDLASGGGGGDRVVWPDTRAVLASGGGL